MEESKKEGKEKLIIGILLGIIVIMIVGIGTLFATGKLSLEENKASDNKKQNGNINNYTEQEINHLLEEQKTELSDEYEITYEEDVYATKSENEKNLTNNKRNIAIVKNEKYPESAKKIQDALLKFSNGYWEEIKKTADTYKQNHEGVGVNFMISTGVVNKNRLSFKGERLGSFGGVSWSAVDGINFDAKTGEVLTLDSISNNSNEFKETLKKQLIEKIEKDDKEANGGICLQENTGAEEDWKQIINKDFDKFSWMFTDNGMEIYIQKYHIACGGAGIFVIKFEKEMLNKYLLDDYKI